MKRPVSIIFVILIFCTFQSRSQVISGTKGKAIKQAKVEIRSLKQETDEGQKFKAPNPGWQIPEWTYNKSKVIYRQPESDNQNPQRLFRENSPPPDTSFQGQIDNNTSIPPDVNGAAGPDHLMQTLNTGVRISDKTGNSLYSTSLSAFWSPMPNNGNTFDPKIVYDPYNDRWIMITPSGSTLSGSKIYIGASTGSDPLGEWNMYWIDPDTTNQLWFDYPNLGFNKNWISIGGIMRNTAFEAVDFVVFAIDLQAVINGEENPTYGRFTTTLGSAIVPSFTYDPDQEEMYLVSTGDGNDEGYGYINLFKLSGDEQNPIFELQGSIGIPEPWENWSYENHDDFLPQLGSSEKLNSVDARMHTMINRNNKLWAVHHIYIPADNPQRCAVQWWHIDTSGVILERGRIDDPTNEYSFAYPSIAVNANEDVFIGHGVFSDSQYAGAGYSFKAYYDDANSMRNYFQYKEGLAAYYKTYGGDRNRWGDYSSVFVDPILDVDFWAMHEYAELPASQDQWGTWLAFLRPSFPPVADFTSDEVIIPTGETINFNDLTIGVPTTWNWTFEQGAPTTSENQNPQNILFDQEGVFDVTLIVSNELGTDTIIKEEYVTVSSSILPDVEFEADKDIVCTGETVSFTDLSLYSPIQWEWQFDPSSVSFVNETDQTSQNPEVIFDNATTYSVTLTVWNLNGSFELTKFDLIIAGGYVVFQETFEEETFRPEEWIIENPDDNITWEIFETGGAPPGNKSVGIDFFHYYSIGKRDRIITPAINLEQTQAFLFFEYAYAKRIPELTDSLIVYVSGDCGENWTRVFAGGEDGTGNFATHEQTDEFWPAVSADWCMEGYGSSCIAIELADWFGLSNVKIAFESWSGYGNPLFIDNLELVPYVGEDEITKKNHELLVFPNPANDLLNIILPDVNQFYELRLINQFGQVMYKTEIQNGIKKYETQVKPNWPKGVYFFQLVGIERTIIKEVIIY